jgi:hypothetical protein
MWLMSLVLLAGGPAYACSPGESGCRAVEGVAWPGLVDEDSPREFALVFYGDDQTLYINEYTKIHHVSEPDVPLKISDTYGRRVRWCPVHWSQSREVVSGIPPRDFAMALAAAEVRDPRWGKSVPDTLVCKGLASDSYRTRVAAHGCLVRMGEAAIGPCVLGMKSPDPEVRRRCQMILEEVGTGVPQDYD